MDFMLYELNRLVITLSYRQFKDKCTQNQKQKHYRPTRGEDDKPVLVEIQQKCKMAERL